MKQEKIKALENDNRLVLTGKSLRVKDYWDERENEGKRIDTLWNDMAQNTAGSGELEAIMGRPGTFDNPKPTDLIMRCLTIGNKNGYILDFFAGSGTTGHAVMKLNSEDGGHRQFILCTNNENNICESVTFERLKRVINGYGATTGIPTNLKYYRTDYVAKDAEDISEELLAHIAEMIQLEHGVKLDGKEYLMVMSDDEADALEQHWADYPNVKALYVSKNVLLTTAQNALFRNAEIHIIPDNYFKFELKEVGEAW